MSGIDRLLDTVEWVAIPNAGPREDDASGLPWATHEGVLRIGDAEFECFQLSTGERVWLRVSSGGSRAANEGLEVRA